MCSRVFIVKAETFSFIAVDDTGIGSQSCTNEYVKATVLLNRRLHTFAQVAYAKCPCLHKYVAPDATSSISAINYGSMEIPFVIP